MRSSPNTLSTDHQRHLPPRLGHCFQQPAHKHVKLLTSARCITITYHTSNPGSLHRLHNNLSRHNMPLPHFDDQNNLEPPPSFQRASPRVCIKGKRKRCAVPGADKHGQFPEAGKYGITTITSSSISKSRTTAASHTNSANENHSCKNDSYHKSHAPSTRKISSSLERPDTKPAPSQSGHASSAVKSTITATSAIDAGAAPRSKPFDPWNSSSTGHQRAENILNGSTAWRESRNAKLSEQFRGGLGGGIIRVADTVGAGSEGFGKDGRKKNGGWEKGASGLRIDGQRSLAEVWEVSKGVKGNDGKVEHVEEPHDVRTSCNAGREDRKSSIFFACYHQGQNIDDRPVFNYTISNLYQRGRSRNTPKLTCMQPAKL